METYSLTDPLVVRGNTVDPEKHNLNIHYTTAPAQTSTHLVSNTVVETVSIHQRSSTPNLQPKNTIATEPQIAKESHVWSWVNKLDGVAPFVADPPHAKSITY